MENVKCKMENLLFYIFSKYRLLCATDYLTEREAESMLRDCIELEKLLTAIIKTMKQRKT